MLRLSGFDPVRLAVAVAGGGVWLGLALAYGVEPQVPATIPPSDAPAVSAPAPTKVISVEAAKAPLLGEEMLPRLLAEARTATAGLRDYAGHLVRQERVQGKLQVEQVCELRVRTKPFCVNVRVIKPLALAGEETSYMAMKTRTQVRHKPAGVEGVKGFQTLSADHAKVLADTRHTMSEVGFLAVIDRVDSILRAEKTLGHTVPVTAQEYTFAGKATYRCELFTERPYPGRYAHHVVVFFEKESKLPVRFEAYDAPKPGATAGELIECQSVIDLKLNNGLGDSAFVR